MPLDLDSESLAFCDLPPSVVRMLRNGASREKHWIAWCVVNLEVVTVLLLPRSQR